MSVLPLAVGRKRQSPDTSGVSRLENNRFLIDIIAASIEYPAVI